MGIYINPKNGQSKERWLNENGSICHHFHPYHMFRERNTFPVVLINNGHFTAAGIGFSEDEYNIFTDPSDKRPKVVYAVDENKLLEEYPALMNYIKG